MVLVFSLLHWICVRVGVNMALTVKKATLWRREIDNKPGTLAQTLKPFAQAGINLQVVMGYTFPKPDGSGAVEVYPVVDAQAEEAARKAGLSPAREIAALIVEGDDRVGTGYEISRALSEASINLHFAMFQVIEKRYCGVFGFANETDANKAEQLIKQACESLSRA